MVEPSGVLIGHIVWPTKAELILARTSNSKSGMRDAGCGMRDAGCGMQDAGCGMRDAGNFMGRSIFFHENM
jgi:hypothetical protein